MTEEARQAFNAYKRAWRKKNPDKVRAANARYWEKVARKKERDAENSETKR